MSIVKTKTLTAASLNRREVALRIERAMFTKGFTFETLSAYIAASPAGLRNIITGANPSPKSRQRVTNALGEPFWPGIKVTPKSEATK